jgi:hypothetical protein
MVDLGPIDEPVNFDWEGAAALSAEFRRTASVLEGQIPSRNTIAQSALEEWRGVFAQQFEGNRMKICTSDARTLANAMWEAATKLDGLAADARAEQERRDAARAWKARHDAWLAEQNSESNLEKAGEWVAGVVGVHVDSPEPEPFTQGVPQPKTEIMEPPPLTHRAP